MKRLSDNEWLQCVDCRNIENLAKICMNCGQKPVCDNCLKEHNHGYNEKQNKKGQLKRRKNKFTLRIPSIAEKCVYDLYVIQENEP